MRFYFPDGTTADLFCDDDPHEFLRSVVKERCGGGLLGLLDEIITENEELKHELDLADAEIMRFSQHND